jgi:choline dehydrogenase-like flavoprotein
MSRQVKNLLNRTPKLGRLSHIVIHNRLEQAPNPDSRVFLSNEPDIFGNKKVALDWRISSVEKESIRKFHDVLRYAYKRIGEIHSSFEDIERWPISSDAAHHMGTTRMALSEKDGVVDKDCKVFGLDNLFVAGSSVFPTSGNANPTFTILALSLRLADHLKRKLSS